MGAPSGRSGNGQREVIPRHRRDIGLVSAFSYLLTSREADATAVVRSPAMISIATDTTRQGLVTHATERVTAGSRARLGTL